MSVCLAVQVSNVPKETLRFDKSLFGWRVRSLGSYTEESFAVSVEFQQQWLTLKVSPGVLD